VEPVLNAQVEHDWEVEIQKYDAGLSICIPSSRVFAELDEKLK